MTVKGTQRPLAVPPPAEGPWRLPDHLDLPPAELPRTDGAPPWCFPDHTMLPETDGSFVKNVLEPMQSQLLTETIAPVLNEIHANGNYLIGQDLGLFWKLVKPPLAGAVAPDWYYIPGVAPLWYGEIRRSYVLWQEEVPPLLAIEYVSGNGSEERDATPETGKFWIYAHILVRYYAIYDARRSRVDVYRLKERDVYESLEPNARGHFPIPEMRAELGLWEGEYQNEFLPWLRWWDSKGNLLPIGFALAEQERQRAEQERQRAEEQRERAEQAQQRAEKLAKKLRSLGIDPNEI